MGFKKKRSFLGTSNESPHLGDKYLLDCGRWDLYNEINVNNDTSRKGDNIMKNFASQG